MNRITKKLNYLKSEGKKALITFVTCGDGGYDTTEKAVYEMEKSGADIIELGIPFSDPIAEGPIIQDASHRALKSGATLSGIFEMVKRIRKDSDIPLLFMLYANTAFRFGTDKFFSLCHEIGIDGVIIPDLPFEERFEVKKSADNYGIINISLVTPQSANRIEMISKEAEGFLYCVSSAGVTGMRSSFTTDFEKFITEIKKYTDIPCAIGFGISTPEQAFELKKYCDGIIVGSAIVDIINKNRNEFKPKLNSFIKNLKESLE